MVSALFDTNILIDHLNGHKQARSEFDRYERRAISVITRMEVLVGAKAATDAPARAFLRTFDMIALDTPVAERAVALRRQYRIKLPEAIVWATAQSHNLLFVTRNTKDSRKTIRVSGYPTHSPERARARYGGARRHKIRSTSRACRRAVVPPGGTRPDAGRILTQNQRVATKFFGRKSSTDDIKVHLARDLDGASLAGACGDVFRVS